MSTNNSAPGFEKTEKLALEFRSADDLFQNYPISIIKQVVDKSKATIDSKQQEMRQLVGAKYTDMLQSANTMNEMHLTYNNVVENIDNIVKVCEKNHMVSPVPEDLKANSEDSKDSKTNKLTKEIDPSDFFYPEYLFGLLDTNKYIDASIEVIRAKNVYKNNMNTPGFDHTQEGIISGFPSLIEEGCKKIFLSTDATNDDSKYSSSLLLYLSDSLYLINYAYIEEGGHLFKQLEDIYKDYSFIPAISLQIPKDLSVSIKQWIYTQLDAIKQYTNNYITKITGIRQLAQLKRDLIVTLKDIVIY
ncbi:hypothetical protein WA158_000041 [Blastocystis sp. Blastoise]